jgi:hypothetical protein
MDQILLKSLLHYNPEIGLFTRLTNCKYSNLSTGVLGVYLRKDGFIYLKIKINRKQHHLGYFKTIEEASAAYIKAKRELHLFGTL